MAGIDPQTELPGDDRPLLQARQLLGLGAPVGIGIAPGVQFHPASPCVFAGLELGGLRIHKQAHRNPGGLKGLHHAPQGGLLSGHIQAPLRGDLLLGASAKLGLGLTRRDLTETPPIRDWIWFKNNDPLVTVGDAKPRYRRETPEKPKPDPNQPKERKRFLGLF